MTESRRPFQVLVYLGATMPADHAYKDAVQALGEGLASRGMTLVFGGSREGTMTVLADAALHRGGQVLGVFTRALPAEFLYPGLTRTIVTDTLAQRKAEMYAQADAVVALTGSFGTWDELFGALELAKVDLIQSRPAKPIAMLNLNGFYDGIAQLLGRSIQDGYTTRQYAGLLHVTTSVTELLAWLERQALIRG